MRFVDEASIIVRSGKGGNGSASLKRAKNLPKGGPDGGDGGKGGDVIFRASNRLLTLYDFRVRSMFEAENGVNGKGQDKYGRNGEDLVIEVPVGTMLWDMTEDEDEPVLLADLARADQEAKALAQRRMADAEREIEFEQRKAVEAVRLDAARNIGDLMERLLLKNLTEEQKQAYQADILSEVKL